VSGVWHSSGGVDTEVSGKRRPGDLQARGPHLGGAPHDRADDAGGDAPGGPADDMIQTALAGVREFLGMDVAFIGEFTDDLRVFRYVADGGDESPVQVGGAHRLEETFCQRVVDGRLPALMADAAVNPEAAALPVTRALPVGAHLSVPITLPDGRLYGTLCAFSADAMPDLSQQHLGALRLLSTLLASSLGAGSRAREEMAAARAEILAVIGAQDFTTALQPIIELRTGRRVGFEALTRFSQGAPDAWFARAAATGLGTALELAALDSAVRHLRVIPADHYLAVNLSAAVLCSTEFAARMATLPLHRLVIELTEQTEVSSHVDVSEVIGALRAGGARVAVDDAGSGYAGLHRIVALGPDILKLDLELIRGIDHDPARQSLTLAMCQFARHTGASVIAEGIETAAQLETLTTLGVGHGQGYHLGHPASPASLGFADRATHPGPPTPRQAPAGD
jgi:EAL domain-containing protein (putative c-di-GMP-specific phosphodiesterase class I)